MLSFMRALLERGARRIVCRIARRRTVLGRGHNLYDIFYGRFRKNETEILKSYIEEAPRDTFKDILDAIDRFVYFENRKK